MNTWIVNASPLILLGKINRLELLQDDCGVLPDKVGPIWNEADELISIFTVMAKNTKRKET